MKIITQNLRHGGSARIQPLMDYVLSGSPDLLVLTEFQESNRSGESVKKVLSKHDYQFAYSEDGKRNGVLVAAKAPFVVENRDSRKVQIYIKEYELKVFGIYLPDKAGSEKDQYWQDVLKYAENNMNNRALMIGDFNSCLASDSENSSKYNAEDVKKLLDIGFVDAWESHNNDGNRYTWWSNHGTGFRLDYLFVSKALDGDIEIYHEGKTRNQIGDKWLSDHCSLIANVEKIQRVESPLVS